ncbi:MAG: hypothetical protein IJC56_07365 [Clostridia bacterium]|nr:hypothetical protein [Clostridia bacterium]
MFDNHSIKASGLGSFEHIPAIAKGLADQEGFTDEYFRLQAFYNEALMEYADSRIDLRGIDRAIDSHELRFQPSAHPVSVFQLNCSWDMKYLFVRINAHIEYLPTEALNRLSEYYEEGFLPGGDKMQALVEETIADALREIPDMPDDCLVGREPDGRSAPNVSLIIGIATECEYDADGRIADVVNELTKDEFLKYMADNIGSRASEAMGLPVKVFIY